MNEPKFTPGPWEWRGEKKGDYEYELLGLDGKDGEDVLRLEDVYPGWPECGEDLRVMVSPSDAALIVAAPDLYAALKACQLQLLQSRDRHDYVEEALNLAALALAKAEGRRA